VAGGLKIDGKTRFLDKRRRAAPASLICLRTGA
jgi:hypothetical protein